MIQSDDARGVTRREWLGWASAAAGLAVLSCGAQRPKPNAEPTADEAEAVARVEQKAKEAGLGAFGVSRTEHFVCLGDAPAGYREDALAICEAFGKVFVPHLKSRGFKTELPSTRMMLVTLKDMQSYQAFLGAEPGRAAGGHYDVGGNRLVIFDFRPPEGETKIGAERLNTFTLIHETAHLLCFNAGLIAAVHEPPECITEGLATYFEMWRPGARAGLGAINHPRLLAIQRASGLGVPWIELSRLFAEDDVFGDEKTEQLAYGQSWLLMNYMLQSRIWQPKLVAYLKAVATSAPRVDEGPVKTAEEHFGSLARLDDRLKKTARSLLRH